MNVEEIKRKTIPVLRKYGVKRGSTCDLTVRSKLRKDSDVYILVEINRESLLDLVALKLELKDALGRKIDLVEFDTIKLRLKEKIPKKHVMII